MLFDLHVHTNHSDGFFTPEKVVDLALERNLRGIAITDHDTVSAIEIAVQYSKKYNNFTVIPSIEFSTLHNNEEVHILGYFINPSDPDILDITEKLKNSRLGRGIKMVKKLNDLGIYITIDEVIKISGGDLIGRPHIARILINKGYVTSIEEAFNKYLDRGKPAYVERYKLTIEEAISIIKKSGGYAVLAHPGLLKNKSIIEHCIKSGINGIECIHSKHNPLDTEYLKIIARSNNLIVTAGSDFHGDYLDLLGKYSIDINTLPKFKERI
ncbi:MAG: PHP domain-containing protein [Tissierellia bacterium]|nr:PHP domain-containing protein [Tissierellia bacterium]